MQTPFFLSFAALALLSTGCSAASHTAEYAGPARHDAGLPDAAPAQSTASTCAPPLVLEAEACVGWRQIEPPPCEVLGLVRTGGRLGIQCAGEVHVLRDGGWRTTSAPNRPAPPDTSMSRPDTPLLFAVIAAELPDGSAVATHGDVYAHPAAWRTDADGRWRQTIPPPSAFVEFGAAIHAGDGSETPVSGDVALFVGEDAYVFMRSAR